VVELVGRQADAGSLGSFLDAIGGGSAALVFGVRRGSARRSCGGLRGGGIGSGVYCPLLAAGGDRAKLAFTAVSDLLADLSDMCSTFCPAPATGAGGDVAASEPTGGRVDQRAVARGSCRSLCAGRSKRRIVCGDHVCALAGNSGPFGNRFGVRDRRSGPLCRGRVAGVARMSPGRVRVATEAALGAGANPAGRVGPLNLVGVHELLVPRRPGNERSTADIGLVRNP